MLPNRANQLSLQYCGFVEPTGCKGNLGPNPEGPYRVQDAYTAGKNVASVP